MLSYSVLIEKQREKDTIYEMNRDINNKLDKLFVKRAPSIRAELLERGVAKEDIDERLNQIKANVQQKMILQAKRQFREELLIIVKNRQKQKIEEQLSVRNQPFFNDEVSEHDKEERKRIVLQVKQDIKTSLNNYLAEHGEGIKKELRDDGISETEIEAIIQEAKRELEADLVNQFKEKLKETVLKRHKRELQEASEQSLKRERSKELTDNSEGEPDSKKPKLTK